VLGFEVFALEGLIHMTMRVTSNKVKMTRFFTMSPIYKASIQMKKAQWGINFKKS